VLLKGCSRHPRLWVLVLIHTDWPSSSFSSFPSLHITPLHLTSPHVTSHHLTSPHMTPHHLTSPHITSRHLTSPHINSRHPTSSHHLTSPHATSHHFTSPHITSHHITTHRLTSQHVSSQRGGRHTLGSLQLQRFPPVRRSLEAPRIRRNICCAPSAHPLESSNYYVFPVRRSLEAPSRNPLEN